MNPHHPTVIPLLIIAMINDSAVEAQIAVLRPYKGQLRLLRNLLVPRITIATVDSAKGKEYGFLILDLVNPFIELTQG